MAHCTFMWPIQVLKTSASVMVRPPPKSTGVFDGVMPALRIAHDSSSVLGPRAIIARALAGRPRAFRVGLCFAWVCVVLHLVLVHKGAT